MTGATARRSGPRRGWPWFWRKVLKRGLTLSLLLLVVDFLVLPQLDKGRAELHNVGRVSLGYLAAGVLLEAAALLAYAALTRSVLPKGSMSLLTVLRIDLSTLSLSHVIPAGTAAGTGMGYRLLVDQGVSGTDAAFAVSSQGVLSAVVLNVLLWLALLITIPLNGFNALYGLAALVGVLLLAALAGVLYLLTRGRDRVSGVLTALARRVPFLSEDAAVGVLHDLAARLRELASDRVLLRKAVLWASANWLLDAASLWVFLGAFGHFMNPVSLLVCYGLANVIAAIPITPGGLGLVEGVLIPTLVGFGVPSRAAVLGVLTYRLLNFWIPIPVGALAYVSLRVEPGASRQRKVAELRHLSELRGAAQGGQSPGIPPPGEPGSERPKGRGRATMPATRVQPPLSGNA